MAQNWRLNKGKKIYTEEQRKKWREYKKRVHSEDNELHDRRKNVLKNWITNNPDKAKNSRLKNKYGITLEQFNSMLKAQDGKCAVCKIPFEHRRVNVDHDHKTKRNRGLLCYHCNTHRVAANTLETASQVVEYLKREKALGL